MTAREKTLGNFLQAVYFTVQEATDTMSAEGAVIF